VGGDATSLVFRQNAPAEFPNVLIMPVSVPITDGSKIDSIRERDKHASFSAFSQTAITCVALGYLAWAFRSSQVNHRLAIPEQPLQELQVARGPRSDSHTFYKVVSQHILTPRDPTTPMHSQRPLMSADCQRAQAKVGILTFLLGITTNSSMESMS
jgi:hypothetical protein